MPDPGSRSRASLGLRKKNSPPGEESAPGIEAPGGTALLLSLLGASLVGLSGYLGGELVYGYGVRVGQDRDGIPGAS